MGFLKYRSTELEIMDLPNPDPSEIRLAIYEIERINHFLQGFNQTLEDLIAFSPSNTPLEIQDWGCGSGDLLRKILKWTQTKPYHFTLQGFDNDPQTILYAEEHSKNSLIQYKCIHVLSPEIKPDSTDIVISCLFTHHFKEEDWIILIKKMYSVCRKGVIINDLHRHPIAYHAIGLLTKWFAKSYMVRNDAPLSVAKGFKKNELISMLIKSGITQYKIRWVWAFRWSILIFK